MFTVGEVHYQRFHYIIILYLFQLLLKEYEREIASLKEELSMHNTMVGGLIKINCSVIRGTSLYWLLVLLKSRACIHYHVFGDRLREQK